MLRRPVESTLCLTFALALAGLPAAEAQWLPPRPANAPTASAPGGGERGGAVRSQPSDAETDRAARLRAIRQIPRDRLAADARRQIDEVIESPTLFRRLPTQQIASDPDLFIFLVRHPEVLVSMWEVMGITKVKTQRVAPYQLEADDHAGTECNIDLVYGNRTTHLFYATGQYDGPLTARPVTGKGVFVLHSEYVRAADGSIQVVGQLDCFLQLDNLGADLLARTLSGVIGRTADSNFAETARFIGQISQSSQRNPQGMLQLASRLPQVQPDVREQFVRRSYAVYERHLQPAVRRTSN